MERLKFFLKEWKKFIIISLENIRDWCISRQIWWGHRIPAWYGPDNKIFVAIDEIEALAAKAGYGKDVELRQEEDVLDTWFSSALWPFSTMGWPEKTKAPTILSDKYLSNRGRYYFLWVARMIMFGLYELKQYLKKCIFPWYC